MSLDTNQLAELREAIKTHLNVAYSNVISEVSGSPISYDAEYLKSNIKQEFNLATSELSHSESISSAFSKVHSHLAIDNPHFASFFNQELCSRCVPEDQRDQARDEYMKLAKKIKKERGNVFDAQTAVKTEDVNASKRRWKDACGHPNDSYKGTVTADNGETYDVYVDGDRGPAAGGSTEDPIVCMRYGDGPSHYIGWQVSNLPHLVVSNPTRYSKVVSMLKDIGHMSDNQ